VTWSLAGTSEKLREEQDHGHGALA
jgi:hypothetical protein